MTAPLRNTTRNNTTPKDLLATAPKNKELETIIRGINAQPEPLTEKAIKRFRNNEQYTHQPNEVELFFRQQLIEGFIKISDEYNQVGITRGGNRPGIIHIQNGAYALQTIGLPNHTILKYITHDRDEELADSNKGIEQFRSIPTHLKKIMNLDSILNERPLVKKYGFTDEVAVAAQILSDNHMFIAKQLRNYTEKKVKGKKRRFYHIKPKQIANQFKEMQTIVTNKHLKEIIRETENAFANVLNQGANASQALKMINRNSIIYPEYVKHIEKYLKSIQKKDMKHQDKQRIIFDILAVKAMDCINNAVDDENMNSQRRTRRLVKEFEILKLMNKYEPTLKEYEHHDKLTFLQYTLGEIHINKLHNHHDYFNMKKPNETKASYINRIKEEKKLGSVTGYMDFKMMKRHEQTLQNIKAQINRTNFEEQIRTYKQSESFKNTLNNAKFYEFKERT